MLLYLLAVLFPPLGILVHGKIFQAAINAIIWGGAILTPGLTGTLLWLCASSHASYVIHNARRAPYRANDPSL